jgi:hypothetical protein
MRQALHILKKDLHGLHLPVLVVYAAMLMQFAGTLRDPLIHDPIPGLEWLGLVVPLAMLVAAGMLVQQEPLVGTTAFWVTKPIKRGSLLLSKILFLAVFVMMPAALATLATALAYGVDLALLAPVMRQSIISWTSLLAAALLLAAITPNLSAYLTLGIGFSMANQALESLVEKVVPLEYSFANERVQGVMIVLSGVLLICHQYFTRRTRRSVAGLAIACVAASLVPRFWPWPRNFAEPLTPSGEHVVLALNPGTASGVFHADPKLGSGAEVTATPEVIEAPAGRDLSMMVEGNLRLDQETDVHFSGITGVVDSGGVEAAMPGFRWIAYLQPNPPTFTVARNGEVSFEELVRKPGVLQATISGELFTYRLAGAIPVTPGARLESREVATIVERVLRRPNSVQVELRVRQVQVPSLSRFPRLLLINRSRGEMLEGAGQQESSLGDISGLLGPTLMSASKRAFAFNSSTHPIPQDLDDDWMRDAELAFLEWVPAGRFRTGIEINDFRMTDAPFVQREVSNRVLQ